MPLISLVRSPYYESTSIVMERNIEKQKKLNEISVKGLVRLAIDLTYHSFLTTKTRKRREISHHSNCQEE